MPFGGNSKKDKKDEVKDEGGLGHEQKPSHTDESKDSSRKNTNRVEIDSPDHEKKPKSTTEGKYKYRLTPEEQEIAYDLRANTMKKLETQNNNLEAEINMHKNVAAIRKKQQQRPYTYRIATGTGISQHNMKLLMKSYEKKSKDAEDRIRQLEKDLEKTECLAKRYHDMYLSEKEKCAKNSGKQSSDSPRSASKSSPRKPDDDKAAKKPTETKDSKKKTGSSKQDAIQHDSKGGVPENKAEDEKEDEHGNNRVTEEDLDDDEAKFKRHIARIADTKSMRTTSPIRVQDVIRKNEVLIQENEALKYEVQRLKWDNAQLVKKVKAASADKDKVLHLISTSEAARKELAKRLEKEIAKNQKLTKSLTRQAADWIELKKSLQENDDRHKLAMLYPLSASEIDAQERTYMHPVKKNVYMPRYMFPVEQYAQVNKST